MGNSITSYFRKQLLQRKIGAEERSFVVAVSGGVDSMVMLRLLAELKDEFRLRLTVAHFDHKLRANSASDLEFVVEQARNLGLPFAAGSPQAAPATRNIEAWARKERYAFLEKIRIQSQSQEILTAHHADDIVETVLMHLLTNKQCLGISSRDSRRYLFRPLLGIRRQQIVEWAEQNKVAFVEDSSNLDRRFLRNRVRHEILPSILGKGGGEVSWEGLYKMSLQVVENERALLRLAQMHAKKMGALEFGSRNFLLRLQTTIRHLPQGVSLRLLQLLLKPVLGFRVGLSHVGRAFEVVNCNRLACELPSGVRLERKKSGLFMLKAGRGE